VLVEAKTISSADIVQAERNAILDQQIAQQESFGRKPTQADLDRLEKFSSYYVYLAPVTQLVGFGIGCLVIAGIAFAVFNAMLGGDATFKQVFAVVAHSGVILATLSLFTTPLAYVRESMSSATNLAVFLPLHFVALATALRGEAALDGFLRFADAPLVKVAEWGLVVLLALHLTGGVRLLLIEFRPWRGLRKDWIAGTAGAGALVGLVYALALWR